MVCVFYTNINLNAKVGIATYRIATGIATYGIRLLILKKIKLFTLATALRQNSDCFATGLRRFPVAKTNNQTSTTVCSPISDRINDRISPSQTISDRIATVGPDANLETGQ